MIHKTVLRSVLAALASMLAGFLAVFPTAVILAIINLDLVGHGGRGIDRPLVFGSAVLPNISDFIVLVVAFLTFAISLALLLKFFVLKRSKYSVQDDGNGISPHLPAVT